MKATDIPVGEGRTDIINLRAIAIYNNNGTLHAFENICPHLACSVEWNDDEGVWDCPCHGSRFNVDGSVLRGPSIEPLPPLTIEVVDGEITLVD